MTHGFHGDARGRTSQGEVGSERVTQRMKIRPPALGVDEFNSSAAKIALEGFHFRQPVGEDLAWQERQLAQLRM